MNPVVHFEMGYNDKERMCSFYEKAFGWKLNRMGPEMGNYVVAMTGDGDAKTGRPTKPGYINGGFYKKTESPLSHPPSVVVAVPDIKKAMNDVTVNGGTILGAMGTDGQTVMEPQMIPGIGLWISAMDTEENRFSLLQPNEQMDLG